MLVEAGVAFAERGYSGAGACVTRQRRSRRLERNESRRKTQKAVHRQTWRRRQKMMNVDVRVRKLFDKIKKKSGVV